MIIFLHLLLTLVLTSVTMIIILSLVNRFGGGPSDGHTHQPTWSPW